MKTRHRLLLLSALIAFASPTTVKAEIIHSESNPNQGQLSSAPFVLSSGAIGNSNPNFRKWGPFAFGTGATVTWSIMGGGLTTPGDDGTTVALSSFMPAGFLAEIQAAFNAWSAIANINFVQVADSNTNFNSAGATGDIRISGHAFDGAGGVLAHGFFPPTNGVSAAGDLHFDSGDSWFVGPSGTGFSVFFVALHEIGHAIGLGHTGVPNSVMNPFYNPALISLGLQPDDIAGAQYIYGPRIQQEVIPEPPTWIMGAMCCGLLLVGSRYASRKREFPTVA